MIHSKSKFIISHFREEMLHHLRNSCRLSGNSRQAVLLSWCAQLFQQDWNMLKHIEPMWHWRDPSVPFCSPIPSLSLLSMREAFLHHLQATLESEHGKGCGLGEPCVTKERTFWNLQWLSVTNVISGMRRDNNMSSSEVATANQVPMQHLWKQFWSGPWFCHRSCSVADYLITLCFFWMFMRCVQLPQY